jgi:putative DNA primase/helicase
MPKSKLEWALFYAQKMGWPVLPLFEIKDGCCTCVAGRGCGRRSGKHPRTKNGVHNATTDPEQIREWWGRWPNANIGLATGRISDIIVIDVDPGNGGNQTANALRKELGPLPRSLKARSGGGGVHYIFKYPDFEVRSDRQIVGARNRRIIERLPLRSPGERAPFRMVLLVVQRAIS